MATASYGPAAVLEARSGRPTLKVNGADGASKALHSLYDPEAEAKALVDAFRFDGEGLLVVLGLGLGYHVARLAARYPGVRILVVEASQEIYELCVKYGRTADLGPEVEFVLAASPEEAIREVTRRQVRAGMPRLTLFSLAPAVSAFPGYYEPIRARLGRAASVRLWDRLKYRKLEEERVRVALIDFGYFLTREIEGALVRLGHTVRKVPVRKGEEGSLIVSRIMDEILSFRPDFFLTVNHLGFDETGALTAFFRSIEMPVASWYVDSPNLIVKAFRENVSPWTSLFLWDKGYVPDMRAAGFEDIAPLPLATDEKIFRPPGRGRKKKRALTWDVGFVGNSMVGPTEERLAKVDSGLHGLVDRLAEECLRGRSPVDERIKALDGADRSRLASLDPASRVNFEAAVLWRTTLRYRLRCVEQAAGFDLRVHGDRGWSLLLNGSGSLGRPLDYYRELAAFYSRCRINLNATNLQMGAAVNQRVFDVPACGAFLLTDRQEALDELFDVGKEVIAFEAPEEIPGLLRFYLDHPEKRRAVTERGRARVLREHTYRHRLRALIEHMRSRYGRGRAG